jgi:hypothetical protein
MDHLVFFLDHLAFYWTIRRPNGLTGVLLDHLAFDFTARRSNGPSGAQMVNIFGNSENRLIIATKASIDNNVAALLYPIAAAEREHSLHGKPRRGSPMVGMRLGFFSAAMNAYCGSDKMQQYGFRALNNVAGSGF